MVDEKRTAVTANGRILAKQPSLSVFFPAYNDAKSLPALLEKTFCVLEQNVEEYEVIVVNDGSRDDTASVLVGLQQVYGERLRVVTHKQNRGYGGALRSGFEAAKYEYVFYTDGDAQYDPGELPELLARIRPDVGNSKPAIRRRHVVLPEPDGPSIEKNSPSRIWRSIPATATTASGVPRAASTKRATRRPTSPSKRLTTPRSSTAGGVPASGRSGDGRAAVRVATRSSCGSRSFLVLTARDSW